MRRGGDATARVGTALFIGAALLVGAARAADLGAARAGDLGAEQPAPDPVTDGVPCGAPVVQSFPTVWQGHFQGGYSHYVGVGGPIVLDWREERLCFPNRGSCRRHIAEMRRDFHRPEGYFTCLPIR